MNRDDYIVLGVPWKIREVPPGSPMVDDDYGKADFNNNTIWVATGPPPEMLDTLIHETIHVIVRGREKCDLTSEDDLRTFASILSDTLLRNGFLI